MQWITSVIMVSIINMKQRKVKTVKKNINKNDKIKYQKQNWRVYSMKQLFDYGLFWNTTLFEPSHKKPCFSPDQRLNFGYIDSTSLILTFKHLVNFYGCTAGLFRTW